MEYLFEYEMIFKVLFVIQVFKIETTILGIIEHWFKTKWQVFLMCIPFGLTMYFIYYVYKQLKELK